MRLVTISGTEYWHIPDANIVVPAYDLFIDHFDTTAGHDVANGDPDTLTVDSVVYTSAFYNGRARFCFGDNLKFNAALNTVHTASATSLTAQTFRVWTGVSRIGSQLPAVLFIAANSLSIIPDGTKYFCMESDNGAFSEEDTTAIAVTLTTGETAKVWMGEIGAFETDAATAKSIRLLPICAGDVYVDFILQNGESRRWYLSVKRKSSTFTELTKVNTIVAFSGDALTNETSLEISDGANEDLTTLYISGLQKAELDEISQLAVSRYVLVNGHRAEIVRRSAIISGNTSGGSFSIDVKNMI